MGSAKSEGSLKVDGFTIDEGIKNQLEAYRLQQAKSDTAVPENHPILKRQNRITPIVKGLEGIVKKHLGEAPRFNPDTGNKKAESILKELAYALAQTEGYGGKIEGFNDELARSYLGQVSTATGNPIFGNMTQLIRIILDLNFANPDNEQYDKNSPLAQLISYIAVKKDKPSNRSNYERQVMGEKWNMLGEDGRAIPRTFTERSGIKLKPYATSSEAFGELERAGTYELQGIISKLPKTYKPSNN
ncbi:MAG: hypothetical protein AABX33_05360 [Nanoarchaeota archaeon]